jgi:hypothetical protein
MAVSLRKAIYLQVLLRPTQLIDTHLTSCTQSMPVTDERKHVEAEVSQLMIVGHLG